MCNSVLGHSFTPGQAFDLGFLAQMLGIARFLGNLICSVAWGCEPLSNTHLPRSSSTSPDLRQ